MPETLTITICMGSSCFTRGNNRNIELIRSMLADPSGKNRVELTGHLCENQCKLGPNISISGTEYHEVDPVTLTGLLNARK